jgi:hypothetical protein
VRKTTDRLSELINTSYEKYDCGHHAVIAGGLTARRDIIEPLLSESVRKEIKLVFPQTSPIFGAAVRCIKLFGEESGIEKLKKNLLK